MFSDHNVLNYKSLKDTGHVITIMEKNAKKNAYICITQSLYCTAEDAGTAVSISGSGRSPGEGICYPLQYSGLENSMDCIVHGVAKNQTRLSDFHFLSSQLWAVTPHLASHQNIPVTA